MSEEMDNELTTYIEHQAEAAKPFVYSLQIAHSYRYPVCPACYKTHKIRLPRQSEGLVCECTQAFTVYWDEANSGWYYSKSEASIDLGSDHE